MTTIVAMIGRLKVKLFRELIQNNIVRKQEMKEMNSRHKIR